MRKSKALKGVRRRGDSWMWDLTFKGKRYTGTEATAKRAEMRRQEKLDELRSTAENAQSTTPVWTIKEAYDQTVAAYWSHNADPRMALLMGRIAVEFFGEQKDVNSIKSSDVVRYKQYIQQLPNVNANGTVNRYLAHLSKMFSVARDDDVPVTARIPWLKEKKGRVRFLTKEEELAHLNAALMMGQTEYARWFQFAIDTGARTSETLKLTTAEILKRPQGKWLAVFKDTKNGTTRSVPLTARATEVVSGVKEGPIFRLSKDNITYRWQKIRKRLGYADDPEYCPHCLRHTFASRLAMNNVSLFKMQQLLGHESITITQRYAHLSRDSLDDAVDVLED